MNTLLRTVRSNKVVAKQFTRSMTIPVNSVARVIRMKVAGEPEAESVDAILKPMVDDLKEFEGFSKVTRHVCKTEWAYEVSAVFDGLDNFKAYMDSPKREDMLSVLEEVRKFAIDGEIYTGNRVHDDF
jgi:antibiotic biosynthesis monooxygenase (ABM) superfamily enzyme